MTLEMTNPLDTGQRQNVMPVCTGNAVQKGNTHPCLVITNIYNAKIKGLTLMELVMATGKLIF
jgi:hypothetical protein